MMTGTLLFIHGTGVRNVSASIAEIRQRSQRIPAWPLERVIAVEWGLAVGPSDLDIGPALPPDTSGRALAAAASPSEEEAALWELLLADPLAELRVLAQARHSESGIMNPAEIPADVKVRTLVEMLDPGDATINSAGFKVDELAVAKNSLIGDEVLAEAASAVSDTQDPELIGALARALIAIMLREQELGGGVTSPTAYDPEARDSLEDVLAEGLAPGRARGMGGLFRNLLAPIATRVAMRKRSAFMDPLSDFMRDVVFYVQRGDLVRDYIAEQIRLHHNDGPIVLLAHSLGGIAAVDLLSDPAVMDSPKGLKVELLVTVGSQSPLLYLMDALAVLSPKSPDSPQPFVPWLNLYNRQDLLSFCASGVFVNSPVHDEPISAGVPFPMSHSAYWNQDRVYELIVEYLPT